MLFRSYLEIEAVPETALLTVHALSAVAVVLDGRTLLPDSVDPEGGRVARTVDLRPGLTPGRHELLIAVRNERGPPLLLAYSPGLGLRTGEDGWAASFEGTPWRSVADVDSRPLPPFMKEFPSSTAALLLHWRLFACTFLVAAGLTWIASSRRAVGAAFVARLGGLEARHVRTALLLAWSLLAVNSLLRIPLDFGFDWRGHASYIRFIAEQGRIPLASDGWEMFQAPLYYLIAALPFAAAALPLGETANELPRALLLIPLVSGGIQIQLAYVATRRVFPGREDLQALGTLVAGFLPINLYSSQHIGNEPLAGVLSAGALVVGLGVLAPAAPAGSRRDWLLLGALLGLALLTKLTAALLLPPLLLTLAWKHWRVERDARELALRVGLVLVTVFSICGWYYVRNWIELGRPFLIGTETSRGIPWWQDPGYRTPRDFLVFGAALEQPLYASVHGFWDGLYASLWSDGHYSGRIPVPGSVQPWNEEFLIAGSLLGLVPSLALATGVARSTRRLQTFLAALCLLGFLVALLYLFLRVPHFSAVKANYTLGLLPAYAVLAAAGFEPLIRHPIARSTIVGALACWALAAYRAYFAELA